MPFGKLTKEDAKEILSYHQQHEGSIEDPYEWLENMGVSIEKAKLFDEWVDKMIEENL